MLSSPDGRIDPVAYVRATPPFDELPEDLFAIAARSLEVSYHPAGTWLVRAGGKPLGPPLRDPEGLGPSGAGRAGPPGARGGRDVRLHLPHHPQRHLDVAVEQDLLAYRLPDVDFQLLLADARFASHLRMALERLPASLEALVATSSGPFAEVRYLIRQTASVEVIFHGGRRGQGHEREAVLAWSGTILRRPRRSRPAQPGAGAGTRTGDPVVDVYSRPLRTVEANTPVYQAWTCCSTRAHHLP